LLLKVVAAILIFLAVLLMVASFTPYPSIRQLANHLAKDGSLDSFTSDRFQSLVVIFRVLSLVLIITGSWVILFPIRVLQALASFFKEISAAFSGWFQDAAIALRHLRLRFLRKDVLIPVAALCLFAFLARILYINDPMRHDEAYSFVTFAKLPLRLALSDYHFPNNHLFHTFFLHIAQRLFGNDPWVVRLPAFLAGIGLVPAGYLFSRQLYGKNAALLSGAVLAGSPALVDYSVNSRGYSLMALITLLCFILAVELTRKSNLFYWSLLGVFSALGFYTLPVFLIPFCFIFTWLVVAGIKRQVIPQEARANWFVRLVLSAATTFVLTGLLYLPVFLNTGIDSVIANPYIQSLSWQDFWPTLLSRLQETGSEWTFKIPSLGTALIITGLGFSMVFHRKISRVNVSTQLTAIVSIPLILILLRVNAWAKIWLFLLPIVLVWVSGGLAGALKLMVGKLKTRLPVTSSVVGLAVILLFIFSTLNSVQDHPDLRSIPGPIENAAIYLKDSLQPEEIVVIAPVDDAPLWYYFYKYDLPQKHFRRDIPFRKAYVLISRDQDQTLDQVLRERGPDRGFLDLTTTDYLSTWGSLDLYSIDSDWQAVSKAYNLHNN
jgi:hypothetical protein